MSVAHPYCSLSMYAVDFADISAFSLKVLVSHAYKLNLLAVSPSGLTFTITLP